MSDVDAFGEIVGDHEWVARDRSRGAENLSPRQLAIEQLEVAAVILRDAEVARSAAGAAYREALDRFNAIVAPLPK